MYAFAVTNSGNVRLRGLQLLVPALAGSSNDSSISCTYGDSSSWTAGSDLAAGAILSCRGSFSFNQDAIDAGDLSPAVTATAANLAAAVTEPLPAIAVTNTPSLEVTVDTSSCTKPNDAGAHQQSNATYAAASACVMAVQLPPYRVSMRQPLNEYLCCKSSVPVVLAAFVTSAGAPLSCIATVLNAGNVRLGSISLTATGGSSCIPDNQPLLPNATTSCTITKAAIQDNFEAGGMTLAFSASASHSGSITSQVTASDSVAVTLPVRRDMVISLARSDNSSVIVDKAGTVVELTVTASNTGNVHLQNVTLNVADLGELACSSPLGSDLLVGDSLAYSGAFAFDQDALEAGSRNFSAAGAASNLGGAGVSSNTLEVAVAASPQLQLDVDALNCSRPARMREFAAVLTSLKLRLLHGAYRAQAAALRVLLFGCV